MASQESVLMGNWDWDNDEVILLPSLFPSFFLPYGMMTWPSSAQGIQKCSFSLSWCAWPLIREPSPSLGVLLHFRVYPGAFPQWLFHMYPYLPGHGLTKGSPCQGSRWCSVMAQTFCLSLQSLSTPGGPSSSSTTSNRSRNRTRYRTKAISSEVDESLFRGNKVSLTQPLQAAAIWRQ